MTVQECYNRMEGDYEGVMGRLLSEERVKKYLLKMKDDNSMENFRRALEEEDYKEAFRCVHNLKGISLNLGLLACHRSSDILCEKLRNGKPAEDITEQIKDAEKDYEEMKQAVEGLE